MMMSRRLALTCLLVAASGIAHADESLLWRANSTQLPVVVPAYAGQPSPFPGTGTATFATTVEEEQARQARSAALEKAEHLLGTNQALAPELRSIAVGGRIEGQLGPRVLINNAWVGVGQQVSVRLVKSTQAIEAIATLREYDTAAADEFENRLNTAMGSHPVLNLTLSRITSDSLVFASPQGPQTVRINMATPQ